MSQLHPSKACAALGLLTVLLGGCAGTSVPHEHFYRLPVQSSTAKTSAAVPVSPALSGALIVKRLAADALLSQRPLVFAEQSARHDLKQYHYHLWTDPPPRMLQELTVQALRAGAVAEKVITADARVLADYELGGKIRHLEHLRGKSAQISLRVEFSLNRLRDGKLLWVKDFGGEYEVADPSIASATRVMGEALDTLFEQLVQTMKRGDGGG